MNQARTADRPATRTAATEDERLGRRRAMARDAGFELAADDSRRIAIAARAPATPRRMARMTLTLEWPAKIPDKPIIGANRRERRRLLVERLKATCESARREAIAAVAAAFNGFATEWEGRGAIAPDLDGADVVDQVFGRICDAGAPRLTLRFEDLDTEAATLGRDLERAAKSSIEDLARRAGIRRLARLDDYPDLFPAARAMSRRIVFNRGPTNSGKTYQALEAMKAGPSGVYLAPLRMMAMEVAEQLNADGVPTTMITGEEEIRAEGAMHVAQTIETVDLGRIVDVAIVDEIQVIADPERGWAWTEAMIGLPAKTIYVTGSGDALGHLERIVQMTGDRLEVVDFERKVPLRAIGRVDADDLQPADAIIAFSRSEVLRLREYHRAQGHSVAALYGALSPEVRRSEASRFRRGDADILIATDAIGMGLNLPIGRVLFCETTKFDGVQRRPLTAPEYRQIGGRAGRYGHGPNDDYGEVGVIAPCDDREMRQALAAKPAPPASTKLPVIAPYASIEAVARSLGTSDLATIIETIDREVVAGHRHLVPARTDSALALARAIASSGLDLRTRHGYLGCPARIGGDRDTPVGAWAWLHGAGRTVDAPRCPFRDTPDTQAELSICEDAAHALTAWLWLAKKWPQTYAGRDAATAERARITGLIEAALASAALSRTCRGCQKPLPTFHRYKTCGACHRGQAPRWR